MGCFNVLKFWLSIMEYKSMRKGEAGFSHTARRIYREFILERDMLDFVDSETRVQLGEILETEKRAPPDNMYDEIFTIAGHELYEKGFVKEKVQKCILYILTCGAPRLCCAVQFVHHGRHRTRSAADRDISPASEADFRYCCDRPRPTAPSGMVPSALLALSAAAATASPQFPWYDQTLPRAARVSKLVAAMTLEDKVGQLTVGEF